MEVSTVYVLYRNLCHDRANKLLLLFIANLEFSLSQGLEPSSVADYALIRIAFEGRVPTILGLWALDLMRQVMHLAGSGEFFGQQIGWVHEQENKLVQRLERGDFMSDD